MLAIAGAAAALAVGLAVPWDGSEAHKGGHGHHGDDSSKLLFFASDGMRQDAIERYADEGVTPGFRDMLKHGAYASGHGMLTQAPPNTGAGWFTMATGAWPAVHGSTNNTFHINSSPFNATPAATTGSTLDVGAAHQRQHPAGRDARAVGRARRQAGRADRVGGRALGRDQRPDGRLPPVPLRPRRRDQLHRARGQRVVHRLVRPAVRPPGRVRRPRRVPAGRADRRDRLDERAEVLLAGEGDAPARPRRQQPDVGRPLRRQRLPLRLQERPQDAL